MFELSIHFFLYNRPNANVKNIAFAITKTDPSDIPVITLKCSRANVVALKFFLVLILAISNKTF